MLAINNYDTYCRFAAATILALLCSSAAAQESAPIYDERFGCSGGSLDLQLPASYEAVRAMRKLEQEIVSGIEDWEEYKTEDRELVFSGLTLYLVAFANDKSRYMISGAVITGAQWVVGDGIRVGGSVEAVLCRLDQEVLQELQEPGDTIAISGDNDMATFSIHNNKVTKITYGCYTG